MLHPFGRHAREFSRAIGAGEWERTADGIVFPRHGALLSGRIHWRTRDLSGREIDCGSAHNLITAEGLNLLGGFFLPIGLGHLNPTAGYIGLWSANLTPGPTWSDYYLATVALEIGDGPEGYTEPFRQAWSAANVGSQIVSNTGSPATFTVATASQLPVCGYAVFGTAGSNAKRSGLSNATFFDVTTVTTDFTGVSGQDEIDSTYGVRRLWDLGSNIWYDPSGDDFYDSGAGTWVDPSLDSFSLVDTQTIFAIVRTAGASPTMHNNGDTVSVVYELDLTT